MSEPGECALKLAIPSRFTSDQKTHVMLAQVDVVDAVAPMLIAKTALSRVAGKIYFATFMLELLSWVKIKLAKSPTGRVLLPGAPVNESPVDALVLNQNWAYNANPQNPDQLLTLTDVQLKKIHLQLGRCSPQQLAELVKFSRRRANRGQIDRIHQQCGCKRSVRKITPPVVSSWVARFIGEIAAMDIIYPFAEFGIDQKWHPKRVRSSSPPSLLVVFSLTRFITCSLPKDVTSATVSQTFLYDWAMHIGQPQRIILDQGGPGFNGHEWWDLGRVFGRPYIKAPTKASYQNGLAKRSVRSLKAAIQSIAINDGHLQLTQEVITRAAIAKNHSTHAIAGLPPAFAMAGRCDIASGSITCMWEHDPLSRDSLIPQMQSIRGILDARAAIMREDSENAAKLRMSHNLPDGQGGFLPHWAIGTNRRWETVG